MKDHEGEKVELPPELMQMIIKAQVEMKLTRWDACKEVARLAEYGSKEFDKAVEIKADKLAKARYFDQLNRTRNSIALDSHAEGYSEGYAKGLEDARLEANFHIQCTVQGCSEIMHFSSRDSNWPGVERTLAQAFADWNCGRHHQMTTQAPSLQL